MPVVLAPSVRDARLQAILDAIDPGSEFTIYRGAQPPAGGGADPANELGVIGFLDPAGGVTDQVLTLNLETDRLATADGSPTWARITDSTGAWVADLTHGADFVIDPVPVYVGGTLNVTTAEFSE